MSEKEEETKKIDTEKENEKSSSFDENDAINTMIHELCEEENFPLTREIIENHFDDIHTDLESLFTASLDICLQTHQYEQARKIVSFLDSLNYLNQGVEEIIREYPQKISQDEAKYISSLKRGSTTEEDALMALLTPEALSDSKNTADLINALYSLSMSQAKNHHDDLVKISMDAAGYLSRVVAFLILVDCGYTDLSIKNKKGFVIKPTKEEIDRLLDKNPSQEIYNLLMSVTKDVSLTENATSLYSLYFLYTFPEKIVGSQDEICCALHIAARYYMQVNDGLTEENIASIWKVDLKKVFPILEGIIEADSSLD